VARVLRGHASEESGVAHSGPLASGDDAEKQAAHPNCGGGDDGDETPALEETTETLVFKGFG
jgi:hypothetical protein